MFTNLQNVDYISKITRQQFLPEPISLQLHCNEFISSRRNIVEQVTTSYLYVSPHHTKMRHLRGVTVQS